jgi:hypothetical protein
MFLYWAIELSREEVMKNKQISDFLANHPELIPLDKIHSTLLFVGRTKKPKNEKNLSDLMSEKLKITDDSDIPNNPEEPYIKINNLDCVLTINQFGFSENALALDVESILFQHDNSKCPSNAIKQHVTLALAKGVKAVDSVKTLLGEGTIEKLDVPLILYGKVKGYKY